MRETAAKDLENLMQLVVNVQAASSAGAHDTAEGLVVAVAEAKADCLTCWT